MLIEGRLPEFSSFLKSCMSPLLAFQSHSGATTPNDFLTFTLAHVRKNGEAGSPAKGNAVRLMARKL